ncbi:hypothetical protein NP233_g3510 [Leucocoprinus birnbaumii]|uniref:Nephrocystin 3-like N-terminal domain-containing protein n=1 Tax=Leucocoprinus birnbaumii TaxID=56174 RepID=A0AAD5VYY7_9AGAR|nr:hypothetical protein NP233_g3510 [Leucocoprinus birnbaumii]
MTATELPPEILSNIFKREFKRRGPSQLEEIKRYSLVCSSWRFPAQHELFSTFVITSLNRPRSRNALPYSIIAKDQRYSHIGPSIQVLQITLRHPLTIPVDPDFYLFLAHLSAVHVLIFTNDSAKILFRTDVFTPQLRNALRNLFQLPTLVKLAVSTAGFPLAVIPSASNLHSLVLFSSTRGLGPLCDAWYDVREEGQREVVRAGPQIRVRDLNLFGDPDYIDGFTTWLRDPKHQMSTTRLSHATIQFYRSIPAGPKTIFCDFRHVEDLTVQFLFTNPLHENQTQIDMSNLALPTSDIENLINLRAFRAEYPSSGRPVDDIRKAVAILSTWVVPFLHCLPEPNRLESLELYMITPSIWSRLSAVIPQPEPGTENMFTEVWESMDKYVDLRFMKLEKLALFMPWSTYEEVLGMLPKCTQLIDVSSFAFSSNNRICLSDRRSVSRLSAKSSVQPHFTLERFVLVAFNSSKSILTDEKVANMLARGTCDDSNSYFSTRRVQSPAHSDTFLGDTESDDQERPCPPYALQGNRIFALAQPKPRIRSPLSPQPSCQFNFHSKQSISPESTPSTPTGMFHQAKHFTINNSVFQEILYIHRCLNHVEEYVPSCYPNTRRRNIETLHRVSQAKKLIWLSGPAGVGKTTIMRSIADLESDWLGAKVMLSKAGHARDLRCLVQDITDQLAYHSSQYRQYVSDEISADQFKLINKGVEDFFRTSFEVPSVKWDGYERWLILIDGLENCDGGERAQREMIKLIGELSQRFPDSPFTWIIASRPEWWLKAAFSQFETMSAYFHDRIEIDTNDARQDLDLYLQTEATRIKSTFNHHFSEGQVWPSDAEFKALTKRAAGFFTYATNASRFIEDQTIGDPIGQLSLLLETPLLPVRGLYLSILKAIPLFTYTKVTRRILGCCMILPRNTFHATSLIVISNLLGISQSDAYASLQRLYSVLDVPLPQDAGVREIRVLHPTFSDFLQDKDESRNYYIDRHEVGADIVQCSLRILQEANRNDGDLPRQNNISLTWVNEPCKTKGTLLDIAYDSFRLLHSIADHKSGQQCLTLLAQVDFSKLDCYCRPDIKTEVKLLEGMVQFLRSVCQVFILPQFLRQFVPVKEIPFRDVGIESVRKDRTALCFQFISGKECYVVRPSVYSDLPVGDLVQTGCSIALISFGWQWIREKFKGLSADALYHVLAARRCSSRALKAQLWGDNPSRSCLLFEYEPDLDMASDAASVLKEIFFVPYSSKSSRYLDRDVTNTVPQN